MTAEIALLNRRGLAFAADSAMTISNGSSEKIYNSAEKIFELSRRVPMGLMLFNNMEFMGVPIDVMARKFRSECDDAFANCEQACAAFLEYIGKFSRTVEDEADHVSSILSDELREISKEHRAAFQSEFTRELKKDRENLNLAKWETIRENVLVKVLSEHAETHEKQPLKGFLEGTTQAHFLERYKNPIDRQVAVHLAAYKEKRNVVDAVYRWAFAAIKSEIFSDSLTGLVFGGFGTDDLFPSLHAVEIDGVVHNQIKYKVTRTVDIDRRGERAAIVPFAQSEMVERFLYGIDAELENTLIQFVQKSTERAIGKLGKVVDLSNLGIDAKSYSGDVSRLLEKLKQKSRDETLDMVDFMPKQELAYTAEAFVTLTSIKRKVSAQQETVGGPVDVAMITRNEGFIWIKRKHYFSEELNPGYRVRTFRHDDGDQHVSPKKKSGRVGSSAKTATEPKKHGANGTADKR